MMTASLHLEGRVARDDYTLRLENTKTFVAMMTRVAKATGLNVSLADWGQKPGRTNVERIALLNKVLEESKR